MDQEGARGRRTLLHEVELDLDKSQRELLGLFLVVVKLFLQIERRIEF